MKCRCGRDFCYKCGGIYLKCECCTDIRFINVCFFREKDENIKRAVSRKDEKFEGIGEE
jgi:hypothetical protein